jgi:DNA modification methylase
LSEEVVKIEGDIVTVNGGDWCMIERAVHEDKYELKTGKRDDERIVVGSKPLWLMRALVRDYSRPGDLVCDPCAGGGTTLAAARAEGRRSVGAELDPETWRKACERLAKPSTLELFGGA